MTLFPFSSFFGFWLPSGTLYRDSDDVTTGAAAPAARGTPCFPLELRQVRIDRGWSGLRLSLFPVVPCGRRKKERKKGIAVGVSCVDLTYKYIRTYTHLLFLISIFSFFSLPPYLFFSSACDYYFPIGTRVGLAAAGGRPTLCSLSSLSSF